MFTQSFFTAEPGPEDGETSGIGRYVKSAADLIAKGAEKSKPLASKAGTSLVAGGKKFGEVSFRGLKSLGTAARERFGKQRGDKSAAPDQVEADGAEDEA